MRKIKKIRNSNVSNDRSSNELDDSVKRKVLGLGMEVNVMLQRSMAEKQRKKKMKMKKKLGEEEQAAVLLMALSMPGWVGLCR